MSDQGLVRPSIPAVWYERIRQLKAEPGNFPPGVFVSTIQYINPLQWRVISVQEGVYRGFPPGIYIDTNFTQELIDENPNLAIHKMGSLLSILLCDETKAAQSIPVPEQVKAQFHMPDSARAVTGNGVMYRPYGTNPIHKIVFELVAPSIEELTAAIQSLNVKPKKKFSLKDLFTRK